MREQFEKRLHPKNGLHSGHITWSEPQQQYQAHDDDYVDEANGMNWSLSTFLETRTDYKHLLGKYRATKQLQYSTSEHNSKLHRTLLFVKDHFWMNDLDKAMPRVYEEITECLDDQTRKVHNTSCTYQFELVFLNLQDTPELRKLYWSALGQLQFDSNDQVITPELEECACCKVGEQ
ncbi:hypothetical protein F900_01833 [Acinetobacter modestus]|uniref:Uncharacterized protein n=1 Tax=Acinetobacter modestus TaxID=1776740 RepID=N9N705_9GAMM|nr:hypothetical protein [Acinetobacter modestus]ENX01466.1 hypothetical protein F900_01833 [Acinetobacter modestus]